jgi:hypothetical protein
MLLYLSNDVVSAPLPPHLAPGACRCRAIALRLGGGTIFSLGDNLQFLSITLLSSPEPDFTSKRSGAQEGPAPSGALLFKRPKKKKRECLFAYGEYKLD